MQGRFLDMARLLFAHQDRLETDDLYRYAVELELDMERFDRDFSSALVLRRIQDDRLDAELMDLNSTPTFFLGERRHIGPYDSATLIRALESAPPAVRSEGSDRSPRSTPVADDSPPRPPRRATRAREGRPERGRPPG